MKRSVYAEVMNRVSVFIDEYKKGRDIERGNNI